MSGLGERKNGLFPTRNKVHSSDFKKLFIPEQEQLGSSLSKFENLRSQPIEGIKRTSCNAILVPYACDRFKSLVENMNVAKRQL
jgi:hypothetical protein